MKTAIIAAIASLLAAGAAVGATPCKGTGSASAKSVLYYTADPGVLDGLEVTLKLGLEPATFPSQDIAKQLDACVHLSFTAGDRTWTLYGEDDGTPPRWAQAPGAKTIVYLAAMPPADQAHLWAEAQRQHKTDEASATFKGMMFALVEADGDKRRIFGFYDALPGDARLAEAMHAVVDGRTPAILGFDVKSVDVDEDRMLQPFTLEIAMSKGTILPTDKTEPDGVAFGPIADGAVKALQSNLVCPAALGAFSRSAIFTSGAGNGSQEAGCRYVSDRARLAVIATHAAPGASLKDAMTLMMAEPLADSSGHQLRSGPMPQNPPDGVAGAASFLETRDGARQAIWATRRADWWFVEVYALYGPGDEAAVAAAVDSLTLANRAP